MGDKGGKKDKEKNKQQQLTKQKQEEQKKQDKMRAKKAPLRRFSAGCWLARTKNYSWSKSGVWPSPI